MNRMPLFPGAWPLRNPGSVARERTLPFLSRSAETVPCAPTILLVPWVGGVLLVM
jgi:hypothetical protein